jgi:AGZA family xanthine/uracil permease-like MFS transporter
MQKNSYKWAASGDINAFFGLMLDNLAGLILAVGMLAGIFGFPVNFSIRYMVPGTAIGVFVGDLLYFALAFWVAGRSGRSNLTAMPLGLDTPSLIGMVLFVLGPAFLDGKQRGLDELAAARQAWHIGICCLILTGLIKFVLAFSSNWLRRVIPRAGLLGSLAAIALVLIAFYQVPKIFSQPMVGIPALVVILVTLIGKARLPFGIPGALASVGIGCLFYYLGEMLNQTIFFGGSETVAAAEAATSNWFPTEWLGVFKLEWWQAWPASLSYLGYVIPFAITTVIGGIDCTESAAAAGDEYHTGTIIGIESVATLIAALCGGVIQTTPYIGHPAYKAMGARAAYTLATAIFIGAAGVVGYFQTLHDWIPEVAVVPILLFIGLEITAQSFVATPRRHYAALAIACLPALAKLLMITLGDYLSPIEMLTNPKVGALRILAGGFIVTSLMWSAALALIIDRRYWQAGLFFLLLFAFTLCGFVHSPWDGEKLYDPRMLMTEVMHEHRMQVIQIAGGYFVAAFLVGLMEFTKRSRRDTIDTDEQYEALQ